MSRDGKTRLSLKIQPPKSEEDTTSKSDTCELANDPPNEPGCWWRSPLGCPDGVPSTGRTKAKNGNDVEQGDGRNPIWRRDSAGDKGHDACEVSRRQILAQECGDGQVQAHWNPPLETPPPAPTSSPIPRVGKQGSGRCIAQPSVASAPDGVTWAHRCPQDGAESQGVCEGLDKCEWIGTCWATQDTCKNSPKRVGNFEVPYLSGTGECLATPGTERQVCESAVTSSRGAYDGATVKLELLEGLSQSTVGAFPGAVPLKVEGAASEDPWVLHSVPGKVDHYWMESRKGCKSAADTACSKWVATKGTFQTELSSNKEDRSPFLLHQVPDAPGEFHFENRQGCDAEARKTQDATARSLVDTTAGSLINSKGRRLLGRGDNRRRRSPSEGQIKAEQRGKTAARQRETSTKRQNDARGKQERVKKGRVWRAERDQKQKESNSKAVASEQRRKTEQNQKVSERNDKARVKEQRQKVERNGKEARSKQEKSQKDERTHKEQTSKEKAAKESATKTERTEKEQRDKETAVKRERNDKVEKQQKESSEKTTKEQTKKQEISTKEQEAKDRKQKELQAKERTAKEQAVKEKDRKERNAKELDAKEKAQKERDAKEKAAKERDAKERSEKEQAIKESRTKEVDAKEKSGKASAMKEVNSKNSQPACGKWLGWGPAALQESTTLKLLGAAEQGRNMARIRLSVVGQPASWRAKQARQQPSRQCSKVKGCRWSVTRSAEKACLAQAQVWHTRCGNDPSKDTTLIRYQASGAVQAFPPGQKCMVQLPAQGCPKGPRPSG